MIVPADELAKLRKMLEHAIALIETRSMSQTDIDSEECGSYVEPGPDSPRQWFTVKELQKRWGCSRSKIYDITELELPVWTKGGRRYFWSHVWAYEGRITMEEANKIYYAVQASEKPLLPNKVSKLTRVR